MGKIITNREIIPQPPAGQLRYGIFDTSRRAELDTRGIGAGYQWVSDNCGTSSQFYNQTCDLSPVKTVDQGADTMTYDPFWVVSRKRCGTVGRTAEEALAAARAQLTSDAQTIVEATFWQAPAGSGLLGLTDFGFIVTPSAPGAGAAISALEQAFYDFHGYMGTIHVNTAAEGALKYAGMLDRREAGVWKTPIGSTVSIGNGYGIVGPGETVPAAGFVWAYMTMPVTIWRSGILPQPPATQTLDRTLNQWDTVAEEVFLVGFDCTNMTFAVQVPVAAPATAATPAVPV